MHTTTAQQLSLNPFNVCSPYAVLRLRIAPSWYGSRVTETLASQIRALAAERHYDQLDPNAQRALRREIADELGTLTQNVVKALKQTGTKGRRREHAERCPLCEHAIVSHSMREAIARNMPKLTRVKKK